MELKGKRELFCREYLARNLNGPAAALAAGYCSAAPANARFTSWKLLSEEEVQDRLAELSSERIRDLKVEAGEVLLELLRMARSDISQAFDENGALKPIHEIPIDCRRAISSIESKELYEMVGEGDQRRRLIVGHLRTIKLWPKTQAVEMLGRHLALFRDKLELAGNDGGPIELSDPAVAARVSTILDTLRERAKIADSGLV